MAVASVSTRQSSSRATVDAATDALETAAGRPDGIRDTIESIVVAFILAFVFRAFLVEAFVIPTGSMAPGLYGQHVQHRCDLCQYPYAFGIREPQRLPNGSVQQGTLGIPGGFASVCPNCGFAGGRNSQLNRDERLVASAGDRILVLKWPFDIGGDLLGPKRWDVVVFKDPQDGETNFIKRLIGLPGEVLQILDGDVFTAPVESVDADILETLRTEPPPHSPDRPRLSADQQDRLARVLKIRRKPAVAQSSLWMIHYNHDFVPDPQRAASYGYRPPAWKSDEGEASGWDARMPRVRFDPPDDQLHWLRLVGRPIHDYYGYNDITAHPGFGNVRAISESGTPVNDVKLSFVLRPIGGDGYMELKLTKNGTAFVARINATGHAVLSRIDAGGFPVELKSLRKQDVSPYVPHGKYEIEFVNLDYRVALRVDGREVLATDDDQYAPDPRELVRLGMSGADTAPTVAMAAADWTLQLDHLAVHRDVYYRSDGRLDNASTRGISNPRAGYPGWGTTRSPTLLRQDPPDYFCMGDNSPQSKDSRLWWEVCPMLEARGNYKLGTVPGDQLIGRAFFVYWPSGHRLSRETPAIIPNVGRMRLIR